MSLDVDGRTFTFGSDDWRAGRYDEWSFYRNKLSINGVKGVDLVAVHGRDLYLIEVKDYTHPETRRVPLADLPDTVTRKALDTLAGLFTARLNATGDEQVLAARACQASSIRLVLHIELPARARGRLADPASRRMTLQQKLRQRAKALGGHPTVEDGTARHGLWSTT